MASSLHPDDIIGDPDTDDSEPSPQRPIRPIVWQAPEKLTLEQQIERLSMQLQKQQAEQDALRQRIEALSDESTGVTSLPDPSPAGVESIETRTGKKETRNPEKPKYPTVELHGVFQVDAGWFQQQSDHRRVFGDIRDGGNFRRARLSANGSVVENVNYFMQFDFAVQGRPTFTDVWMEFTKVPVLGNVRVGQWKQPFSLEVVSSFRYTTFAERSVLFQSFAPFRHIAAGFYDWSDDERMTWAASVYKSGQDQYGGSISDNGGYSGVGRITGLPWYDDRGDRYLHLGGAWNYTANKDRLARFRTLPEYFIGEQFGDPMGGTSRIPVPAGINGVPFFVDTLPILSDHFNLLGAELLWVEGPLSVQSEYMYNKVDRGLAAPVSFHGLYSQVGCFLTGEHRPYLRKLGAIDRIKVKKPVNCDPCKPHGCGAWELAVRYSTIDLDDEDVRGGKLTDWTGGVNWYINDYTKFQFNYIRAYLDNHRLIGETRTDIYGLRAQIDF